jgi:tetratricopeptide (TPR) repeat protein
VRKAGIILGGLLIVFALTGILLGTVFRDNLRLQRMLSPLFSGSNDRLLERAGSLREKGTPEDLRESIGLYREILSRDAANPYRWCDLGLALTEAGRVQEALDCYRRAVEVGPNNIRTLWLAAGFYIRVRKQRDALEVLSHILEKSSADRKRVFDAYLNSDFVFPDTLKYGIPSNEAVARAYLRYLIRNGDAVLCEECWNWIRGNSFADDALAGDYASFLFRAGDYRKSRDTWADYLGERRGDYLDYNYIYNPGMEREPGNSPFDWKLADTSCARMTRVKEGAREGYWALRIIFNGRENPSFRHVAQRIYLEPGRYRFRGWIRADSITTDEGVGIRIAGFETEKVAGTVAWKLLQQTFTLEEPKLIRFEIIGEPSEWSFNRLKGTVFLDDFLLVRW